MKVVFYSYTTGQPRYAGQVTLDDSGRVVFEGVSEKLIGDLRARGAVDSDGEVRFPSEGNTFLHALPVQYSGTYFRAVIEEV